MDDLLTSLEAVVGGSGMLTGDDVASRPASWLNSRPMQARAIVRPADTAELSRVLEICNAARQAVVPLGGNTGLVDGTLSAADDVVVSLERMNRIESIDTVAGTMVVQAGVALQTVQEAADADGFMFPLDLGARGSATIGGALSTNAGGNAVIRYGMMREQVLGLEAVMADGTVLSSMNRMLKNNAGYDLKQLFIGTEGTLGIVTRAVLRLRPALRSCSTALVAVDDYENVPRLLNELGGALGGALTAFEVMWADLYDTVVDESGRHQAPLPHGHPFYVLVEARGGDQAADSARFEAALGAALEDALIVDAVFAQSTKQRDALWAIRDDIDYLVDKLGNAITFDISLPIGDAATYASDVHARLKRRWPETFRCTSFGHLGDGNLHFLMTIGSDDSNEQREAMRIVYEELQPFGGSISAEHGIGLEKRPFLSLSRSAEEIRLMRSLKRALDPAGILNPGKVFEQ